MLTIRREREPAQHRGWAISRNLWLRTHLAMGVLLAVWAASSYAAITEPRLALMRATIYQSATGTRTLRLEGSFSFADAVQLALPLNVVITQGQLTARCDLAGNVTTSTSGGPEQSAAGPGVISFTQREIVVVLPSGFSAGEASAQIVATYEKLPISSNRLSFTL
jgi:hypothetical protein